MKTVLARIGALTAIAGALLTAACGFTPLYATPGVTPALSHIDVVVPHGRTAFLLSQSLDDALAKDREAPAKYKLDVQLTERTFPRGLSIEDVAQYYETHVRVTYSLIDLATGKVLKTAVEPVEVTYPGTDQPYAGVAAQQQAEQRAADEAAHRIGIDLAVFFAGRTNDK